MANSDVTSGGGSGANTTITRTYTVTDGCGNTNTVTRSVKCYNPVCNSDTAFMFPFTPTKVPAAGIDITNIPNLGSGSKWLVYDDKQGSWGTYLKLVVNGAVDTRGKNFGMICAGCGQNDPKKGRNIGSTDLVIT